MSQPTQANRPISISTPLGDDVLLLRSFHLRDGLSTIFEIHAELESTDANIDFEEILGKQVCITINVTGGKRYLNGYVARFVQTGFNGALTRYRAIIVPWIWFLTRSSNARIFQANSTVPAMPTGGWTVPGILANVFAEVSGTYTNLLTGSYTALPYCTQFNETDFNFVQRIMEAQGIYYYHKSTDSACTLILCDSPTAHQPFPMYEYIVFNPVKNDPRAGEHIYNWSLQGRVDSGTWYLNDYDYTQPGTNLDVSGTNPTGGDYTLNEYPYPLNFNGLGSNTATQGADMAAFQIGAIQAKQSTNHGASNALGICVGFTFTLQNCPRDDQNIQYLVTREKLSITTPDFETNPAGSTGYEAQCLFETIPYKTQYRPERTARKSVIQGMQTATVVGKVAENTSVTTNSLGSVCVQFHWDVANNVKGAPLNNGQTNQPLTAFVRVSQAWASKSWGAVFTPHVGDEVVVSFEDGDPDRPIVTGRVYNATNTPPITPDADTSIIQDYGGNYLQLYAKSGSESVKLFTPNNSTSFFMGPNGFNWGTSGSCNMAVNKATNWWTTGNEWKGVGGIDGKFVAGASMNFYVGAYIKGCLGFDVGMDLINKSQVVIGWETKFNFWNKTELYVGNVYKIIWGSEFKWESKGRNKLFPDENVSLGNKLNILAQTRTLIANAEQKTANEKRLMATAIDTAAATVTVKVAGEHSEVATGTRNIVGESVMIGAMSGALVSISSAGIALSAPTIGVTSPIINLN